MANAVAIPDAFSGAVPSKAFEPFITPGMEDELGAGITGGFAVMSIKGKAWRIKYRGNETTLMREDGDGAQGSIEVVIIRAAPFLSKTFYKGGYVDGSTEAPDCASSNGVTPDANVPAKQADLCKLCPQNVFGSKVTDAGKQAKACSDAKKLAIVPFGDMKNEIYGGPMLLRVPAASLGDMKEFSMKMAKRGFPSGSYAVRIGFDVNEAFPKLTFAAIKPLTDEQARLVLEMRDSTEVTRIIAEEPVEAKSAPADNSDIFEEPAKVEQKAEQKAEPAKVAEKKAAPKAELKVVEKKAEPAKAPAKVEPEPQPEADAATDDLDAELEALLGKGA